MISHKNAFDFVQQLLRIDQDIKVLYNAHIDTYGQLLVFVFMGELSHWFIELYKKWSGAKTTGDLVKWSRFLKVLESAVASGNEGIEEIVAVGFLENLGNSGELEEQIASQLPPLLRAIYDQVRWA